VLATRRKGKLLTSAGLTKRANEKNQRGKEGGKRKIGQNTALLREKQKSADEFSEGRVMPDRTRRGRHKKDCWRGKKNCAYRLSGGEGKPDFLHRKEGTISLDDPKKVQT